MTSLLRTARVGPVLRLTLADDATRNALSEGMMTELQTALDGAAHDATVGVPSSSRLMARLSPPATTSSN
jgi:enoyl-CoA hydratase/carnithine racemase